MTRPRTNTVEYFFHAVHHGKTMFILRQKYGNDGYAFWFTLLEELGSVENHYLDLSDQLSCSHLQAKTNIDENKMNEIMDTLSKLDAIDKNLWKKRIVWSQNFVDGLKEVYSNRKRPLPSKPITTRRNNGNNHNGWITTPSNPAIDGITTPYLPPVIPLGSKGSEGSKGSKGSKGTKGRKVEEERAEIQRHLLKVGGKA